MIYAYRKAEETDREAVYHLYSLVMHDFISEIWGWDEPWQQHDFSAHFDSRGITLVHQRERLVGYSHVENRGGQVFVRMIVVHPLHRRRGIGRTLLESIIASGDTQSRRVELEVFKINDRAKRFYEKFGFSVEGENPASYLMARA